MSSSDIEFPDLKIDSYFDFRFVVSGNTDQDKKKL